VFGAATRPEGHPGKPVPGGETGLERLRALLRPLCLAADR
jgi:hypothetical protein